VKPIVYKVPLANRHLTQPTLENLAPISGFFFTPGLILLGRGAHIHPGASQATGLYRLGKAIGCPYG
jgi:hypothetical protein